MTKTISPQVHASRSTPRAVFTLVSFTLCSLVSAADLGPLKPSDAGAYADMVKRPNPQQLELKFIPSLGEILRSVEAKKDRALTQMEVETLRDDATVEAVEPIVARAADNRRGHKDIDPQHAWEEWQALREKEQ